jgi:hypothetical protein
LAPRNHANPIDLLAARYPVVCRLVSKPSFRLAVRRFILSDPPDVAIPRSFANNFPRFLRSLGGVACIEYVADVAELELLRHKAEKTAHTQPRAALTLSSLPIARLLPVRVALHPSVFLIQSRFPIVTTWEVNQTNDHEGMIERWVGEAAMVARPFLNVEIRRLPCGGYPFLRALSEGQTVATAAAIAGEASPGFDVVASIRLIDDARVVLGVENAGGQRRVVT